MEIVFTQAARKHRIGRAHAQCVMASEPVVVDLGGVVRYEWVGTDERGVELEIVAIEKPGRRTGKLVLLVLHVMPTALKER